MSKPQNRFFPKSVAPEAPWPSVRPRSPRSLPLLGIKLGRYTFPLLGKLHISFPSIFVPDQRGSPDSRLQLFALTPFLWTRARAARREAYTYTAIASDSNKLFVQWEDADSENPRVVNDRQVNIANSKFLTLKDITKEITKMNTRVDGEWRLFPAA